MNSEVPIDQLSLSDNTICVKYEVSVERVWAVGYLDTLVRPVSSRPQDERDGPPMWMERDWMA